MAILSRVLQRELPFKDLTSYSVANLFKQSRDRLIDLLKESGIYNMVQRKMNPLQMGPLFDAPCDYVDEESFKIITTNNNFGLTYYHQNIRSLPKHVGELWAYLQCLNFKFDIIMLSEIGLKNFHIAKNVFNDYECFFQPPDDNPKGGVTIFIKSTFTNYRIRDNHEIKMDCGCKKVKLRVCS